MNIGIVSAATKGNDYPSNKRLIEAIKEHGATPQIINYNKTVSKLGSGGLELWQHVKNDRDKSVYQLVEPDVVIPRMGSNRVGVLALNVLINLGIPSTASPRGLEIAADKWQTLLELHSHDIPIPYSLAPTGRTPSNSRDMIKLLSDNGKPLIVKNRFGSMGNGVGIGETPRSVSSIVDSYASNGDGYLVQEFVESPGAEYASDVRLIVVDAIVIAAMKRTSSDKEEFRSNLSKNGIGEPYEATKEEKKLAIKSMEAIGLGVGGVDLLHSARGPLINEINGNPGLKIEGVTGVNVARAIVGYAFKLAS